jgi:hypothetical protein
MSVSDTALFSAACAATDEPVVSRPMLRVMPSSGSGFLFAIRLSVGEPCPRERRELVGEVLRDSEPGHAPVPTSRSWMPFSRMTASFCRPCFSSRSRADGSLSVFQRYASRKNDAPRCEPPPSRRRLGDDPDVVRSAAAHRLGVRVDDRLAPLGVGEVRLQRSSSVAASSNAVAASRGRCGARRDRRLSAGLVDPRLRCLETRCGPRGEQSSLPRRQRGAVRGSCVSSDEVARVRTSGLCSCSSSSSRSDAPSPA